MNSINVTNKDMMDTSLLFRQTGKPKSICTCGHSGDGAFTEHRGTGGHSDCTHPGCTCQLFSWKSFTKQFRLFMHQHGFEIV